MYFDCKSQVSLCAEPRVVKSHDCTAPPAVDVLKIKTAVLCFFTLVKIPSITAVLQGLLLLLTV